MADKLSSPSTASSTSYGAQTPRSRGANADEPFLILKRQPPAYVYSNESFDVEIGLELPKTASPESRVADGNLELQATLLHSKTNRPSDSEATLITEPSRILLPCSGGSPGKQLKLRCMIRAEPIQRDKGAAFEIQFLPRIDVEQPIKSVISVSTNTIHVVNYKIKLSMEEEWEYVWYKDEGGRDKCMEVYAGIYDKHDQLRLGEQVPLHLTLCYKTEGDAVPVTNQEILRSLGSSKIVLDKATGKARIRFRVEDVSKNHQGQDFKLQVGTDPKAKGLRDIAPGYSPAVSVRSKRNKRTRNSSTGSRTGSAERRSSPIPARARGLYDDPAVHHPESIFESSEIHRLRDAMKGVIQWTDEVVNGLYPLQWQVLGYAQHPDGSPDYSRPYHNMQNPNACISHILSMYSDSVRENLRVLLNAIEQVDSPRPESPYAPTVAAMPREPEEYYGAMRGSMPVHGHSGIPLQSMGRRPGLHPSIASEAFRDKPDASIHYQHHPTSTPRHQPMPYLRQRVGLHSMIDESDSMHLHGHVLPPPRPIQPRTRMDEKPPAISTQRAPPRVYEEEESRESEVEFVLAKQYKALRSGERLGFPAYNANKEILGFYRESSTKVGVGQFIPISRHRNDFGPLEIMQATEILEDALEKKSDAVHALKDWGSISNLLDHALVYDWSKDIGNDPSGSGGVD